MSRTVADAWAKKMFEAEADTSRTDAERRLIEAAVDAYRDFYSTITQNNLANATRAYLGGEQQRAESSQGGDSK